MEYASYRIIYFFILKEQHLFCNIMEENKFKLLKYFLYLNKFYLSLFNITKTIEL
jgi:hypothetical protein